MNEQTKGYYLRYKADAKAANLPHQNLLRITKIEATGEDTVTKHPMTSALAFPGLPKIFPNYEAAFAWVSMTLRNKQGKMEAQP